MITGEPELRLSMARLKLVESSKLAMASQFVIMTEAESRILSHPAAVCYTRKSNNRRAVYEESTSESYEDTQSRAD
jgi:hypothetical protein